MSNHGSADSVSSSNPSIHPGAEVTFETGKQSPTIGPPAEPTTAPESGASDGNAGAVVNSVAYRDCISWINQRAAEDTAYYAAIRDAEIALAAYQSAHSGSEFVNDPTQQSELTRLQDELQRVQNQPANRLSDSYSSWGCNADGFWGTPR